jgi:hypothetical protein
MKVLLIFPKGLMICLNVVDLILAVQIITQRLATVLGQILNRTNVEK